MNVADLLHDAPSDDHHRRQQQRDHQQRQQQPSPERDRDRQPLPQSTQSQQQRHSHPSQGPQHSPPPTYYHQQPSRHARPSSPPRQYSQDSPAHGMSQRLPPPSAIVGMGDPYEVRHRRPEPESMPGHHEAGMRGHHGPPPSLGSSGVTSQPYTLEPRNFPRSQPHSHHGSHSNAPPPMYAPSSQQSTTRSHHSLPPPKHTSSQTQGGGSVPLYPIPAGPGMGPPPPPPSSSHSHLHGDPRVPPGYEESSIMYNGHTSQVFTPQGASIMGALPLPPLPPPQRHSQSSSSSQPRHRSDSGGDRRYGRESESPAMGSLQGPTHGPYDRDERERMERERSRDRAERDAGPVSRSGYGPQGPSPQLRSTPGPAPMPSSSSMMRGGPAPPTLSSGRLTGPGSIGVHADREREREREIVRTREPSREDRREVDRERERERAERHRERDMDRYAEERMLREREREHEMNMDEVEREREWRKMQSQPQNPAQVWSRFAVGSSNQYSKMVDEAREREAEAIERQLVSEKFPEDVRMKDEQDQERIAKQSALNKPVFRERDMREKERDRESDRESRRERPKEPRKQSGGDNGWMPEPAGWPKDIREAEREEREREKLVQKERERERERDRDILPRDEHDAARSSRQHPSGHHVHLHRHHHRLPSQTQGPGGSSKNTKALRPNEANEMAIASPGMSMPQGMASPFGQMGAERPPQQNQGLHKSKTVNGHVQHIPGQSPLSQVPPQHQHPSHHPMSMHPHAPPISHSQRRASPPPFASTLAPNNAYMQSQSPRPHLPPSLPPVHIGTFVYPRTPFPFLDFPPPPSDAINTPNGPVTFMEKEIREIRATVYIPSGFLPTKRPREPKIWGGALIPSFAPLFTTPQLVTHMQSGMPYDYRRLRTSGLHGLRRVYTDDSDLFLCALHAGWVKWSSARAARKEGKDLKLEVRLTREARYVGGFGSHYVGGSDDEEDFIGEDDGRTLLSAGWGNSHDGSGVEILNAEFVKRGTAHSLSARNRDQRLLEYADRHHTLTCTQHSRKRRRVLYQTADNDGLTDIEATDRKLSSDRTIILGGRAGWTRAGFEYRPDAMKALLFPTAKSRAHPNTARDSTLPMDVDTGPAAAEVPLDLARSASVFVHTKTETFLIYPQAAAASSSSEDKENTEIGDGQLKVLRYAIAVISYTPADASRSAEEVSTTGHVAPPGEGVRVSSLKEQSPDGVVDMSLSPAESSKVSINGDVAEAAAASSTTEKPPAGNDKPSAVSKVIEGIPDEQSSTVSDPSSSAKARAEVLTAESQPNKTEQSQSVLSPTQPTIGGKTGSKSGVVASSNLSSADKSSASALVKVSKQDKPKLQVLQKDLTAECFVFDSDGLGIVSKEVANGALEGWKIEVQNWRPAGADALPLMQTVTQ